MHIAHDDPYYRFINCNGNSIYLLLKELIDLEPEVSFFTSLCSVYLCMIIHLILKNHFSFMLLTPLIQGPGPSGFDVVCGSKLPLLYELVKLFYELVY